MNRNDKIVKNRDIEKENQRKKNINALKDTEYSSIYSVVVFLASTIMVYTNAFMEKNNMKTIVELIVICVMVFVCNALINKARKKCENEGEKYKSSECGVIVKMATNIGYLSPMVCCVGWVITLECVEMSWKIFMVFVVAVTVFFALQIPYSKYLNKK